MLIKKNINYFSKKLELLTFKRLLILFSVLSNSLYERLFVLLIVLLDSFCKYWVVLFSILPNY